MRTVAPLKTTTLTWNGKKSILINCSRITRLGGGMGESHLAPRERETKSYNIFHVNVTALG
jgi:hypothetical protein